MCQQRALYLTYYECGLRRQQEKEGKIIVMPHNMYSESIVCEEVIYADILTLQIFNALFKKMLFLLNFVQM